MRKSEVMRRDNSLLSTGLTMKSLAPHSQAARRSASSERAVIMTTGTSA